MEGTDHNIVIAGDVSSAGSRSSVLTTTTSSALSIVLPTCLCERGIAGAPVRIAHCIMF